MQQLVLLPVPADTVDDSTAKASMGRTDMEDKPRKIEAAVAYCAERSHEKWKEEFLADPANRGATSSVRVEVQVPGGQSKWVREGAGVEKLLADTPGAVETGNKVDLLKCTASELPLQFRGANEASARAAAEALVRLAPAITDGQTQGVDKASIRSAGVAVHNCWMETNAYQKGTSPQLFVPFDELSEVEQEKDLVFVKLVLEFFEKDGRTGARAGAEQV